MKTFSGYFFEDYKIGQEIVHAVPRTIGDGERAMYNALYPARHALYSSAAFAKASGFEPAPLNPLIVFHTVFGKTVPDISLNAVANLGYADGRFFAPVYAGDTLSSSSEVIGLKENSNGKTGIVYVRTTGVNQHGETVLSYVRWVMVKKRDSAAPAPDVTVPDLPKFVAADALHIPEALDFSQYNDALAGEPYRYGDYEIGEKIDHVDGNTVEETEHMLATRLWQNTAKVHFNAEVREDGKRLIYGGHVISLAQALSFNGLANAQMIVGINGGAHVNPCFSGTTVYAWSEVLDKAVVRDGIGALQLRLVATRGHDASMALRGDDGKYLPHVLLDFDYWALIPV